MLRVGLSGGIACGKTLVRARLAELGAATFDSDRAARAVVAPASPGLAEVLRVFGGELMTPAGELDRARLAERIFADPEQRRRLEDILHPRIHALQQRFLLDCAAAGRWAVAVVDAALMFETGSYRRYHLTVLVTCEPEAQRGRLMLRDRLGERAAAERIAAQMAQADKRRLADLIVDNSGAPSDTREQVDLLYRELLWRSSSLSSFVCK